MAPLLPKLRGDFAEFLNESYLNALEYSSRPPVSVSGTITFSLARGFSGQCSPAVTRLSLRLTCLSLLSIRFADLPTNPAYRLRMASIRHVQLTYCVTPSLKR